MLWMFMQHLQHFLGVGSSQTLVKGETLKKCCKCCKCCKRIRLMEGDFIMSTSAARRLRRKNRAAHIGRAPLPAVSAWLEANRSRFKPGELAEVVIEHDADCRYPGGGECSCRSGPEIRVWGEDPGSN